MDTQFVDRLLICSDCHGEFIFTAGEQLFFHDKQFKNDPKRCKPCKSRRSGLSAAAAGVGAPAAAGLSRTETRTQCSECGVETTVPFKPTQGRPVLCRQCFQDKGKAAAAPIGSNVALPSTNTAALLEGNPTAIALTDASTNSFGATLSPDAAVLASTSISNAAPNSSVATAADLASISETETHAVETQAVPVSLMAAQEPTPSAELLSATAEGSA